MLKNNKVNAVIALLIALILWIYVLGVENPSTTATIKNIPITFTNESVLEENNLEILSMETTTVSCTVSGLRSDIDPLTADDFTVVADLSSVTSGKNVIHLRYSTPENAQLETVSKDDITVTVDKIVELTYSINTVLSGRYRYECEILETNLDSITIKGTTTTLAKIDEVVAELDSTIITSEDEIYTVPLRVLDAKGEVVEGVTLSETSLNIIARIIPEEEPPVDDEEDPEATEGEETVSDTDINPDEPEV